MINADFEISKPFNIIVRTVDMRTREETSRRKIDFNLHDNRVWLSKHIGWAGNNGHGVTIMSEADYMKESERENETKP